MTPPDKLSLEEISKAADDVRTIQNFQDEALNNGFNASVFSASITPSRKDKAIDWPLVLFSLFLVVLFLATSLNFFMNLGDKFGILPLIFNLLIGTLAVMCVHIRFKQAAVTIIIIVGLVIFIAIGFGVLTPKEAIDGARELVK